jgi:ATP-binding cassette subfamily F protein 3
VLLLDEPEAHLDAEHREKLEALILTFYGAVVVASHDRYLLDGVVGEIAELEGGKVKLWPGNYSAYALARELALKRQQQLYVTQQKEIARLEEAIRRFKQWAHTTEDERHARQARNKQRQIERMEKIERPVLERRKIGLAFRQGMRGGRKALELRDASVAFGEEPVLIDMDLTVMRGERVGVVGENGAGKSVLAKVLAGVLPPTEGERWIGPSIKVCYLAQNPEPPPPEATPLGLVRATKPLYEDEGVRLLGRFLFRYEQVREPVATLSGGERTRLRLLLLMLEEPNCLILDEPTNHLDLRGIEWLENFVKNAKSAVLVVSHDRYFLDAVADIILELDDGRLARYPGNYTRYVAEKRAQDEQLARKAKANLERREQLERFIEKNRAKATKAKQAKSKQKLLDRMEKIEGPKNGKKNMKLDLGSETTRSGRVVLEIEDVSYSYDDEPLLTGLELVIERGERVALLGPNGTGKSTIMRLVAGELELQKGTVRLGNNVALAYQDQQLARLDGSKTVLEEAMYATGLDAPEARDLLGAFLFSGDDVFKKVSALSGGEKNRLSLAKIVASDANLLLLDEPTNNLDIPAREALEDALLKYRGTMFFISHDRYFLRKLATRVVELEEGSLVNYLGGYDYYRSHRRLDAKESGRGGRRSPRRRVRPGLDKQQNVVATRLVAVEGEIDATERRVARLEKELATSELYTDGERSRKVVTEHRQLKSILEGLYEDWGELMQEAEEVGL